MSSGAELAGARRTPLYDAHLAAGARLVAFAGWAMPLDYGSLLAEHRAVRGAAGVFDVSHMGIVDVEGGDSLAVLRRVLANDPARLRRAGRALYGCMLNERGGVLDDVVVYRLGEDAFRLVVNAGTREKDLDWLTRHAAASNASVTLREDTSLLAVQGPRAGEALERTLPSLGPALLSMRPFDVIRTAERAWAARTGYTGEDGWELMLPPGEARGLWMTLLEAGVAPCGLGARDTLRLEAGFDLYGQDMDEDVSPFECGLGWTVALEPRDRDFIGRPALEATAPRARFTGLLLEGRGVLRPGQALQTGQGPGVVTSGTFSPTLGRSIGLGRVPVDAGAACEVEIRGKLLPVRCVAPRFVRRGEVLVHY